MMYSFDYMDERKGDSFWTERKDNCDENLEGE